MKLAINNIYRHSGFGQKKPTDMTGVHDVRVILPNGMWVEIADLDDGVSVRTEFGLTIHPQASNAIVIKVYNPFTGDSSDE